MERRKLRLGDMPEHILIYILSRLPAKEVVRSCVLASKWQHLWKSVPVSLSFDLPEGTSERDIADFRISTNRELHYWRSCQKIGTFSVSLHRYKQRYVKDVDLWVHFATQVATVECFELRLHLPQGESPYELPQFAYKNNLWRHLILFGCKLIHSGSVYWDSLISLSLGCISLTDDIMEKVLSGCPNLERLEIFNCQGYHNLEINSGKLRELNIEDYGLGENFRWVEINAPNMQDLQLSGLFRGVRLRNVASLVTAVFEFTFVYRGEEVCFTHLNQLLHSVAHVKKLELTPWCIESLSILELKGQQFPPSSLKFLKLCSALEQSELPGICSFLLSLSALETLVIDWAIREEKDLLPWYTNEDDQIRRFETHSFDGSLPQLKTVRIINYHGLLSEDNFIPSFVKYVLKNATTLEKLVIAAGYEEREMCQDDIQVAEELLSFPRYQLRFMVHIMPYGAMKT